MNDIDTEKAKLLLQVGYFFLLFYVIRRGFDLFDRFATRVDTNFMHVISTLKRENERKEKE